MDARGDIRNPRFANRPRSFSGLKFGNITPTDIDCSVDFRGRKFIFVEGKINGAQAEKGQRAHLENLVMAVRDGGRKAFAVVIEYRHGDGVIDYGSCSIVEWFYGDSWMSDLSGRSLRSFFEWVEKL